MMPERRHQYQKEADLVSALPNDLWDKYPLLSARFLLFTYRRSRKLFDEIAFVFGKSR
jgi:hypothetical protein